LVSFAIPACHTAIETGANQTMARLPQLNLQIKPHFQPSDFHQKNAIRPATKPCALPTLRLTNRQHEGRLRAGIVPVSGHLALAVFWRPF
jgi:hypothetical protein